MGDTGETRDRVGAAGVAIASVFFKIALYICVIVLLFWIGKSAFQFGHDVFNQQAMSPGEGQEITVVIKEDASLYGIAKTLQKKGLVKSAPEGRYLFTEYSLYSQSDHGNPCGR